jgi:hypothetical protein
MPDDAPVRGTLKAEVTTSSSVLEAGRPFSVLVTLQNPFDVAVEITSVTTVVRCHPPADGSPPPLRRRPYNPRPGG